MKNGAHILRLRGVVAAVRTLFEEPIHETRTTSRCRPGGRHRCGRSHATLAETFSLALKRLDQQDISRSYYLYPAYPQHFFFSDDRRRQRPHGQSAIPSRRPPSSGSSRRSPSTSPHIRSVVW